ncbi:MAG: hypothetical protein IJT94_16265 [Oscillibacter sp.]|nr:hypothetical protein [Oscillibacter sp.]
MGNLHEIVNNTFFCIGVWASCTLLDAAAAAAYLKIRGHNCQKQERRTIHKVEQKEG